MMMRRLASAAALTTVLLASAASAQTDPIAFSLTNTTDSTLVSLYISLPSTDAWEEDIFGADMLEPGDTMDISIDDGLPECVYDVRADFSDGSMIDLREVDFCALDGATLTVDED